MVRSENSRDKSGEREETAESNRAKGGSVSPTTSSQVSSPSSAALLIEGIDRNKASATPPQQVLVDNNDDFLNLDGALYRILEYLTPSDFYILGARTGSRFWKQFLFENPHTEYLFSPPGHSKTSKGRTKLKNLYNFRKSVEGILRGSGRKGSKRNRMGCRLRQRQHEEEEEHSLNRVGVFSSEEEDSILSDDANGYFGLSFFRPGVLAIWGDYSGLFLTSRVDHLFSSQKPLEPLADADCSKSGVEECQTKNRTEVEDGSLNESSSVSPPPETKPMGTEGCGYIFTDSYQVMAVLAGTKPYVFLGFASGSIHSIDSRPVYKDQQASTQSSRDPTRTKFGKTVEYPRVSECSYHCQKGEISSLASVENQHMVSSSMRVNTIVSEVLIHWNALVDGNLQNISRIQIDAETFHVRGPAFLDEIWDVSPLAMASSSCLPQWNGPVLSVGARGQNLTHLCLWPNEEKPKIRQEFVTGNKPENPPPLFKPSKSFRNCIFRDEYRSYRARRSRDPRSHHFVYLKYVEHTNLIVGTSKGDLFRIEMDKRYMSNRKTNKSHIYNCCKGGMVEVVELVGKNRPIMITGGGYDGRIQFWDWKSFQSLGSLRIHPGQQALVTEAALVASEISGLWGNSAVAVPIAHHRYSPVVSTFFCHERSSLVSFCRDGHLHEWRIEVEARKHTIH